MCLTQRWKRFKHVCIKLLLHRHKYFVLIFDFLDKLVSLNNAIHSFWSIFHFRFKVFFNLFTFSVYHTLKCKHLSFQFLILFMFCFRPAADTFLAASCPCPWSQSWPGHWLTLSIQTAQPQTLSDQTRSCPPETPRQSRTSSPRRS